MTRPLLAVAVAVAVVCVSACAPVSPTATPASGIASPWPEADALFRRDARFLGADSAYSTSLGDGRVLWLFGDTFVAKDSTRSRRAASFVRNSIAIESGSDPSAQATTAAFSFGGTASAPSSFFAEPGSADESKAWRWPGTPALVDGKLLLFFWDMRATSDGGAFGFALDHTSAVLVDNPGDDPSAWHMSDVTVPAAGQGIAIGTGAALVDGDALWLMAAREPGDHELFLGHLSVADAAHGDLSALTFVDEHVTGQTEFSLTHEKGAYQLVSTDGFGAAPVVMRTTQSPSEPWSAPVTLARPSVPANGLVYSAKAHPELSGADGDLVITYCTNDSDLATLVDDDSIYYPRFLRVQLRMPL